MTFWSQASSEPKRQHRFLVTFGNLDGYQEYLAKSVTKPNATIGETPHKFLGNTYYYPGAVTWESVTCSIIDGIGDNDGDFSLYKALLKSGYLVPQSSTESQQAGGSPQFGASGLKGGTPNKVAAKSAVGSVLIKELDGKGETVGMWTLRNAWITSINFGSLDYAGEELVTIELGLRYDWADYKIYNPSDGEGDDASKAAL